MATPTDIIVQHQASLAGSVSTTPGAQPLGGAQVKITGPPAFTDWLAVRAIQFGGAWESLAERPDRKLTQADGRFVFLDLPPGAYLVVASVPGDTLRFGSAQAQANVPSGVAVGLSLAVPVTSVRGTVKTGDAALALAEVRIKGSGEYTFTRSDGTFLLIGVDAGKRTVVATAPTYDPATLPVTLTPAVTLSDVNLTMNHTPALPQPPPNP